VQQPCSNPSKSPEMLGMRQHRNTVVCSYFAISRKLQQSVALPCAAEGRGSAPLQETTVLPLKHEPEEVFYHIGAIWIAYTATNRKYYTFSDGWLTLSQKEIVVTFVLMFKKR